MEDGTDAASLELRRVTVDERTKLIAEGRYGEEFLRAFEAYLIAHKSPVTEATVTWFSYRSSGPTKPTPTVAAMAQPARAKSIQKTSHG